MGIRDMHLNCRKSVPQVINFGLSRLNVIGNDHHFWCIDYHENPKIVERVASSWRAWRYENHEPLKLMQFANMYQYGAVDRHDEHNDSKYLDTIYHVFSSRKITHR